MNSGFVNDSSKMPQNQLMSRGSRVMMAGSPSAFDEMKSGAIAFQDLTSSSEEDEDYGMEEYDSDESDENIILLTEIKQTMTRMFRRIEKIDR